MIFEPRSRDEVFSDLQTDITSRSDLVSNFTTGSFNSMLLNAYADEIRELELQLLAAVLAGSADYAGRTLTESDLTELGIEGATAGDINRYMDEQHLDLLGSNVGVERESAQYARTTLEFVVSGPNVEITHGYTASTGAGGDDELQFYVDATGNIIGSDGELNLTSSQTIAPVLQGGDYIVEADAVAAEPGPRYNIPDNTITHLPDPQPGITSVTNTDPASGGADVQSTESFRDDVRNALFESSVGGTRPGLEGAIQREVDGLESVELVEYTDQDPPYVDVLADGGTKSDLVDAIKEFRPIGIRHNLLRPADLTINSTVDVIGDVDATDIETNIETVLGASDISDSLFWSSLISRISNAFFGVTSVPTLNTAVDSVDLEHMVYKSGTTEYQLSHGPFGLIRDEQHLVTTDLLNNGVDLLYDADTSNSYANVEVRGRVNGTTRELTGGSEYTITSGLLEIDSNLSLDEESILNLDYTTASGAYGVNAVYRAPWDVDGADEMRGVELSDSEYSLVNDSTHGTPTAIDISSSAGDFSDRDRIVIDYEPSVSESRDVLVNDQEVLRAGSITATVTAETRGDDIV